MFLGPSLPIQRARAILPDADIRPPVSQGDVTRATLAGARVIGIVDGFFDHVPSVWHKEILWAMSKGVHVFGAASMGALRAAELYRFGMVGIGDIFRAFLTGVLNDDDEVAVTHGPAEVGYPQTSEALVDIRATLASAVVNGILSGAIKDRMLDVAKSTYYPQRSYAGLLAKADALALAPGEIDALKLWLPTGRISQKGIDAVTMLDAIATFLSDAPAPKVVGFHFERTDAWEQVLSRDGHQIAAALPDALPQESLLEELWLRGSDYQRIMTAAFARALALREAGSWELPPDRTIFRESLHRFFLDRGLETPDDISGWVAAQCLDLDGLTALVARNVEVERVEVLFRAEMLSQVNDALRAAGLFGIPAGRAKDKQRWLAHSGMQSVPSAEWNHDEQSLIDWYFSERCPGPVPEHLDTYSRTLGFGDRHAVIQALFRDFLHSHKNASREPGNTPDVAGDQKSSAR